MGCGRKEGRAEVDREGGRGELRKGGGVEDRKKQPLPIFAVMVGVGLQSWANVAPCRGGSTLEPPNGLACSIGKQTCSALYRTGVAVIERRQVLLVLNGHFSRGHNKQKTCLQH